MRSGWDAGVVAAWRVGLMSHACLLACAAAVCTPFGGVPLARHGV